VFKRLDHYWYSNNPISTLLLPISWLYSLLVMLRRTAYRVGLLPSHSFDVPVVVVGNITVGGTGKTPMVAWLVEAMRGAGYRPGIVSRGYGGMASSWPQQVRVDSDPKMVGDEPLLLARRCQVPIAVGPDRVAAVRALLEHTDVDLIIADDGLQHYALERDIEIAVTDGARRFGNRRALPAGPLREPVSRLKSCHLMVSNGTASRGEFSMRLRGDTLYSVGGKGSGRPLAELKGVQVHAVAGIGDPQRFFDKLRRQGVTLIEHPFPDHHPYQASELDFGDQLPVIMTEKDAVKCRPFAQTNHWYLPVTAELDDAFMHRLQRLLPAQRSQTDS